MRKTIIWTLFGLGFVLAVVGGLISIGGIIAAANCVDLTCGSATQSGAGASLLLAWILYLVGSVLLTIAWIAVLIKQAQRQQWGWFVCTLLFSIITVLLWLIIQPEIPSVPFTRERYR